MPTGVRAAAADPKVFTPSLSDRIAVRARWNQSVCAMILYLLLCDTLTVVVIQPSSSSASDHVLS